MRLRRMVLALVAGLVITAGSAGLASASTTRGTSGHVFGVTPGFSANAYFSATWTVTSQYSEGHTYWEFSNLWISMDISNGKYCQWPTCDTWTHGFIVRFYNSAGTQVAYENTGTAGWTCGHTAVFGTYDVYWNFCNPLFDVPYTATKLTVHWNVGYITDNGIAYEPWTATSGYIPIP